MDGRTPAFFAALVGHTDCLRLLLEAGCDKDKACEDGGTPASIAARMGHADCLRLLEEAGCNICASVR